MDLLYGIFGADGCRLMAAMLGNDKRTPQIAQLLTMANLPSWVIRTLMALLQGMGEPGMASSSALLPQPLQLSAQMGVIE